jgi:hypothetical protein
VASDLSPLEMMLHVATARGMLGWAAWREAYESITKNSDDGTGLSPSQGTRILDNLAHVELVAVNNDLKLAVAPAVLALLPRLGLPTAVLCGGRSPQTERKLRDAAGGNSARLITAPSSPERQMQPRSFFVEAENVSHLARTAESAGIQFAEAPPAWSLAYGTADMESYLSSLAWRHEPEPSLSASEFAPDSMRFDTTQPKQTGCRLLRYFPRRLPSYFELRDGEKAARTDRDWGLYAVLRAHGRNCLIHDIRGGLVAVPAAAPLPRLFGRVLSLCSGLAPAWLPATKASWKLPEPNGYHVYTGVPSSIAELVFLKLGQSPLPLHVPAEYLKMLHSHRPV